MEYTRPTLATYQTQIVDCPVRYLIVEASTKAGKTTGCIVKLFESSLMGAKGQNYWWVAPSYKQADIAFTRLQLYLNNPALFPVNQSKRLIQIPSGAQIMFLSGEDPDGLYGEDVYGVVMDEASRMRETAWFAIRSTLTATQGWCTMIGNVVGSNNWNYRLAREVEKGKENWNYMKITASDAIKAGILQADEIKDAENSLPHGKFLELYYGIPDESGSNKFCYSFNEKKHIGHCKVNPDYPVVLSFDFNYNPICCGVYQSYDDTIFCCELVKLQNSNIFDLCELLASKFENCILLVTGDASGKAQTAITRDTTNYYTVIKQVINPAKFNVPTSNPKLEQNQVLVNAILENKKVVMDVDKASDLIFDCKFVAVDNEGKIIKTDRNDPTQQADPLDTFRYYLNAFHRSFIKIPEYA